MEGKAEEGGVKSTDRPRLRTYSLSSRPSKVHIGGFGRPYRIGESVSGFLDRLPDFLAAKDLKRVARAVVEARSQGRCVSMAYGAHVIKVGLSPVILDLFSEGWLNALATNGAGMIHDFEIAVAGKTSEDVDAALSEGTFGMAEETGSLLNALIRQGVARGEGLGEAVGRGLREMKAPHLDYSILAAAVEKGIPVTVHVAIGTDIHHMHPSADGADLGLGSHRDFLRFCERVQRMEAGVHINVGSAVVLPEVFLKALSLAVNLGRPPRGLMTVNMDFIQHYRPMTNVVRRPSMLGGEGIHLTGHHELMVPLLAACIKEEAARRGLTPIRS